MHTRFRRALGFVAALVVSSLPFASCSGSSSGTGSLGDIHGDGDGSTSDGTTGDSGLQDRSTGGDAPVDHSAAEAGEAGDGGGGSCDGGGSLCSGVCTNLMTDPNNCGMCNRGCGMSVGMVCVGGNCGCNVDAGLAICGTNCVDLQTDSTNCGACGHDCQGSTCSGGFCVPTVAASATSFIAGLAVTADALYWTQSGTGGGVFTKPFASGTQVGVVATGINDPRGIAVDLINAYWVAAGDGTIFETELKGGAVTIDWPLPVDAGVAPGYTVPIDVATDGQTIFVAVYGSTPNDGEIIAFPVSNPSANPPRVVYSGGHHPTAIAVDGASVYWAEQGTAVPPSYNGCIYQIDKNATNGTPTKLTPSSNEENPNDIAIDETNVYWVDNLNSGWVKGVPIGGGAVVTYASGEGGPFGIATLSNKFDQNVYWTDTNDNTVKTLAKNAPGQAPTVLALGQSAPRNIVVDQKNVYWVNYQQNTIFEVSK